MQFIRVTVVRSMYCPGVRQASASHLVWRRKRDHEAIETYNKMLKKPPGDETYTASEMRLAKVFFDQINEYRRKTEEGFQPSKLFMVWRIATLYGRPYWEKDVIIRLGLAGHRADYAIVKNTPSMNKVLWNIKHLIRLKPITFPDGFPEDGDYTGTFLKQTGELVVAERLKVSPEEMAVDPEYVRKKLKPRTIRRELMLTWNAGYPKLY